MSQFKKKPVVIDAFYYENAERSAFALGEWWRSFGSHETQAEGFSVAPDGTVHVRTLEDGPNGEAKHVASPGDWIIRGLKGEYYPCKADIFEASYDAV